MTQDEALQAVTRGEMTYGQFCQQYIPTTSGGVQTCHGIEQGYIDPVTGQAIEEAEAPAPGQFNYDQAYAAWQGGMPYYEAFCERYTPVSSGGVNQCNMINEGTVDYYTGEYIGDQGPATAPSFPPADGGDPYCNADAEGNMHCMDPAPSP